ncbi:hypothetical protein GCM10010094_88010 [Streptomyces flaveus]|uniref:Uncharacterized protein n=1 Tax=Streptomyces flaveus TaxID=66370 RepID=A0A917RM31_9ACTN|nr:hypothetical protein GCM10010094_88010 [Streptomyces flaveus]
MQLDQVRPVHLLRHTGNPLRHEADSLNQLPHELVLLQYSHGDAPPTPVCPPTQTGAGGGQGAARKDMPAL